MVISERRQNDHIVTTTGLTLMYRGPEPTPNGGWVGGLQVHQGQVALTRRLLMGRA